MVSSSKNRTDRRKSLRIGFVPLCDSAPLVMASELGLFARHGLAVELSREVGWASVRDKVLFRELDAAQAPAATVFAASLGLGSFKVRCVTGLVLNQQGNAITLSKRLWDAGVRDGETLREYIRAHRHERRLTFGVAFSFSSHNYLLHKWLIANEIHPKQDVNIAVVPPPQMVRNLQAGNLEGYCVGEPWNSVALLENAGWIVATSRSIAPCHPEKVLLVRQEFAERRAEEHRQLIAALYEACRFCDEPENRECLIRTMAGPRYLNADPAALRNSFAGPFNLGQSRSEAGSLFHIFNANNANEPGLDKAAWVFGSLVETGLVSAVPSSDRQALLGCFRADIFHSAVDPGEARLCRSAPLLAQGP